MPQYASEKKARGFCDRCGFEYPLIELKSEVVNSSSTNLLVCHECWDPDHPQWQLGRLPVSDSQALRSPRPLGKDSGRDENSLVFEFNNKSDSDGFTVADGTLNWDQGNKCLVWQNNSVSTPSATLSGPNTLTISTALYRYFRVRYKIIDYPNPVDWRLRASFLRYERPVYDIGLRANEAPSNNYPMGDNFFESIWDMSNLNLLGEPNWAWKGSVRNFRFSIFTGPVGGSYKIEIYGIYFDPAFIQVDPTVEYGITNRNFESPQFNHAVEVEGYESSITTQHVSGSDPGGIDAAPGWTASSPGAIGTVEGVMGVHITKPGAFDPQPNFKNYLYMQHNTVGGGPTTISQVTSNYIDPHTKYVLSVDLGRRVGANALEYALKMKAGGVVLASTSSPEISDGKFENVSVDYAATGSGTEIGKAIEIELEQSSTGSGGQVGAHNFKITSSPQFSYDFLDGTATETAGDGTYGVEGWAWYEGGKVPIENSLVWNSSPKTVTLASPNLSASNPWDNPYLTYNYTVGVPASISTSRYSSVTVRMRRTAVGSSTTKFWRGVFYWLVQNRIDNDIYPFGGGASSIATEPSFPLNEWQDVTWSMGGNSAWANEEVAKGWRFDFYHYGSGDTDTKDIFEVDYIRFT